MKFTTMITRTESLSTVNELIDLGYKIMSVKRKGYSITSYKMFRVIL